MTNKCLQVSGFFIFNFFVCEGKGRGGERGGEETGMNIPTGDNSGAKRSMCEGCKENHSEGEAGWSTGMEDLVGQSESLDLILRTA